MLRTYKYRLYPKKNQLKKIAQTFGCARFIFNQCLEWWKSEYERAKLVEEPMQRLPLVTFFKKEHEFLKQCDSLVLMNARRNFEQAMQNYFDSKSGKRKGRYMGFPKFKRKDATRQSFQTNYVLDNIRIADDCLKLPKIGWIPIRLHRLPVEGGRIVSATVTRNCDGRYHVSLLYDYPDEEIVKRQVDANNLQVVGLDMSLKEFVVSSDENDAVTRTKYMRQYRENEKKIARLQRRVSRKKKGSKNREKARTRLARMHSHVANCRHDFICKSALHFARDYDVIVLEDLDMKNMSRSLKLGKSVMDLGFGEFRTRLQWKCSLYGTELVKADKWYPSSKTCNHCGFKKQDLQLSDREWVCPECGTYHDRDLNAAKNLRDYYLKQHNTAGTAEINACGDQANTMALSHHGEHDH